MVVVLVCGVDSAFYGCYSDLTDLNFGNKPIGNARKPYSTYLAHLELHTLKSKKPLVPVRGVQCQANG